MTDTPDKPVNRPTQPRLEKLDGDRAAIVRGDSRVELEGGTVARILFWYEHMAGHSAELAATYLAGVIDGMGHTAARRVERTVAELKAERAARGTH